MPRRSSALNAKLEAYGQYLTRRRRREHTVYEYRRLILHAFDSLERAGLNATPGAVGEEEIYFLYNEAYKDLLPRTARIQLSILGSFLKRMGDNPVVENMEIEWPEDERINAKWIEPWQAKDLKNAAMGMERILVHLELDCLLRRCEVLRMRLQDFRGSQIDVQGKGRVGGKPRSIPYHPKTPLELDYYRKVRDAMVSELRRRNPAAAVPDSVLIWTRFGRVGAAGETTADRMLKNVAERADLPADSVSHHVLRRTGARIQWLAGTPIGAISKVLGHSSEAQTIKYLGLNLDDMAKGMRNADLYMENVPSKGTLTVRPAV